MSSPQRRWLPSLPLLRRLPGGIRPQANKQRSLRSRLMPMPLPPQLVLPVSQPAIGQAPSLASNDAINVSLESVLVRPGDEVKKYQQLTAPVRPGQIPLFAPTSGRIENLEPRPVAGAAASWAYCLILTPDMADEGSALPPLSDYRALPARAIRQRLLAAGVGGLGGAGYSSFAKAEAASRNRVHTLLINGVECEPYITADEALLREHSNQVVQGSLLLQAACNADRCQIVIERSMSTAALALRKALEGSEIELVQLADVYPSGAERQLIFAVSGQEICAEELPIEQGFLVQNTGTAFAAFDAVVHGLPQISRVTTLTGEALQTPKNFFALLGTPVPFLLSLCGIDWEQHSGTIIGGSLMGTELAEIEVPVTTATNCIIAKGRQELGRWPEERPCIRCGDCLPACPVRLQPQLLYQQSKARDYEGLDEAGLSDCIECGACAHACPSAIPLVQYYRAAKEEIAARKQQQQLSDHWQERFQYHQYRQRKRREDRLENKARRKAGITSRPQGQDDFSRDEARQKIADAVARVKARKAKDSNPH